MPSPTQYPTQESRNSYFPPHVSLGWLGAGSGVTGWIWKAGWGWLTDCGCSDSRVTPFSWTGLPCSGKRRGKGVRDQTNPIRPACQHAHLHAPGREDGSVSPQASSEQPSPRHLSWKTHASSPTSQRNGGGCPKYLRHSGSPHGLGHLTQQSLVEGSGGNKPRTLAPGEMGHMG